MVRTKLIENNFRKGIIAMINRKTKTYVISIACLVILCLCVFILIYYLTREQTPAILKKYGINNIQYTTYYDDGAIGYITLLNASQKFYDYMLEIKIFPNGYNECYIHIVGKNRKSQLLDYGEPQIKMFIPIDSIEAVLKDGLPEWANDVINKELQQNNWRSNCSFTTGKTITLTLGINPEISIQKENSRRQIK